jgi:hypothetical protein
MDVTNALLLLLLLLASFLCFEVWDCFDISLNEVGSIVRHCFLIDGERKVQAKVWGGVCVCAVIWDL